MGMFFCETICETIEKTPHISVIFQKATELGQNFIVTCAAKSHCSLATGEVCNMVFFKGAATTTIK